MEHAGKLITRLILLVASLLTLRVIVWFFEQRAHDKEYWLIFAHVIPFLLAIIAGAGLSIFVLNWVLRRLGRDA
ncbi:MAG TPA: hypothetical protein DIC41_11325 [Alphaproteobacteria bacterium]|nr:hypothetical protein [Rhodospirillaceae bacterium]PDH60580.1 MAG: hypothetical protein CNE92_07905 [SAR116 cluster bacterium MED-G05]HAO57263.1 hypothetical protein [Alphaproteobacteria bacterium]MAS74623.1 hypothetical protein [Rhodospirillaceae bacterium]HBD52826.1 hypothetical protein [Alphaproteobacteria bacterium]